MTTETKLINLINELGDLIHNGINQESSLIKESELCRLGRMLRELKTEKGVNEDNLEKVSNFVNDLHQKNC
jgi:hypothetical protein